MRTRAQLSVEFMVYAALATASLVVSLKLFSMGTAVQGGVAGSAYAEELAAAIDSNMGYTSSIFSAYVPASICNATLGNGTIGIAGETIALVSNLTIEGSSVCMNSGRVERLLLYRVSNGTYALEADG
ncbi:MAG TPA: hypothetical protein VMV00_02395 [Candidatus Baltobacteraceae bacterium]|nr:hypothetical protein [Candidatus Baltobacteraceae bacterium]